MNLFEKAKECLPDWFEQTEDDNALVDALLEAKSTFPYYEIKHNEDGTIDFVVKDSNWLLLVLEWYVKNFGERKL